ncbi:MAG: SipW-dependent-type signal peptide-containing protein, partial [Candidatus Scatosoma sp.]
MKKKTIVSSVLAIAMCSCIAIGGTYALFTSESNVNIAVTSGKVDVVATASDLQTYSVAYSQDGTITDENGETYVYEEQSAGTFKNGGRATLENGNEITLDKITPGDKTTFDITITNNSNVAVQYRTILMCETDDGLFSGLQITVDNSLFGGITVVSSWALLEQSTVTVPVEIVLPVTAGNEYQEKTCTIAYRVEAVQGNASVENVSEDVTEIYTVTDLKALANRVNDGDNCAGKTFKLMKDINLVGTAWAPIGEKAGTKFAGTFDGRGNAVTVAITADTLAANAAEYDGYAAFFGAIETPSVIKNLTVNGTVDGKNVAGVVARMDGGTVENCVSNVTVTGTAKAGGVICLTNTQGCTVTGCTNNGAVYGQTTGGTAGIVAYANPNTVISDCVNYGAIGSENDRYSGGIVGYGTGSGSTVT